MLHHQQHHLQRVLPVMIAVTLIVFDDNADGMRYNPVRLGSNIKEIMGVWHLEMNHINGKKTEIEIPSLTDLSQMPETKGFSGTVTYTKTLILDNDQYTCVDLGDVQGVAELSVNGVNLGVKCVVVMYEGS